MPESETQAFCETVPVWQLFVATWVSAPLIIESECFANQRGYKTPEK